ncbi:RHS repeat domain-containing protein [Streptomyces poriticola]|uniref:RHS repeat domain-containing protein n=1 Tax=Streptomyces poriticola TaxID=3120506 RepID=UPI002FCE05D3
MIILWGEAVPGKQRAAFQRPVRSFGRRARLVAFSLVAYLLAGLLGGPVAAAAELELRKLAKPDPVPVAKVSGKGVNKPDEVAENLWKPDDRAGRWPTAGTASVDVPEPGKSSRQRNAGSVPVSVKTPGRAQPAVGAAVADQVQVQVLDRSAAKAAGVDGLLIAVRGHAGTALPKNSEQKKSRIGLELDYADFAGMYGGDWASRLTFREVPACALTAPGQKDCAPGDVIKTHNDRKNKTLSAEIATGVVAKPSQKTGRLVQPSSLTSSSRISSLSQGTTLLAVAAAPSGATGDFTATSLAPSGQWEVGGSSGGFNWSYGINTPSVPGGLEPSLGLSYSSLSVDGRTAATNNQANWAGDGWSLSPGFIERRYVACEDDKKDGNNPSNRVGDQCWKKDNAILSLGGSTSELVRDDTTGEWRKKTDDGTRVELYRSSARANGDNDNEYWRVTTSDGTRYYFGFNRPKGWSEGKDETNSTWTVPVFGNHPGEPCHSSAFKNSWCQQAWRWNLDAVIDPAGNAMTYYWAKETNHYQRAVDVSYKGTLTGYTRGGYLKRIEYGLRASNFYGTPAAKVDFTVAERCLRTATFDCAADKFTETNANKWPDVPFDQYCTAESECEGNSSPSYFTRKRLTSITTLVLDGGTHKKVDSWALTHQFPSTGDGIDPALWLASVTRTGHTAATPVTLPPVTFKGQQLPNRVEGAVDPVPPYNRYRVYAVNTETGGTVGVTYSAPECTAISLPTPATNIKRCYPVIWSPPDAPADGYEPYQDWFHSYVVTQILESDNTSGAPIKRTDYSYPGGLAWAKGDDEFTKAKHRTWGDRRGYGRVQVRTGDPTEGTQALSEIRYFRGIEGVKVADSQGNELVDHQAYAGMVRETATYNGSGGALVSATSHTPWRSAATASHSRSADSLPTVHAYRTGIQKDQTRSTITGGNLRRTETVRQFDEFGLISSLSETGDTAKSGDERCTTTSYARSTARNILGLVAETKKVAKPCGIAPTLPGDLISTTRYYYDGATTLDAEPSAGNETRRDENDGVGTGLVTVNTATYDFYGRQTSSTDATGAKTTVTYTPSSGQSPTKTVSTNALGHTSTEYTDPRRGVMTAAVDANSKRSDVEYDALGRVVRVWGPGWIKADHPTVPSAQFSYRISRSEPNVVTSKVLNHLAEYDTSYTFYDGMLRARQTQTPAIGAPDGRVVTETHYDTHGLAWKTYGSYYAAGKPSSTLVAGDDTKVPAGVEKEYDGAERVTAEIALKYGDETKRTTTQYGGDRTTVIPPRGGTATTTILDVRGRTIEQRAYTDSARTAYQSTKYTYNEHDRLAKLTDPAGVSWAWTYDARGRQIKVDDPDKGPTTTTYDSADRPVKSSDARGIELTTAYDALSRQKELRQGTTVRASWTYDTVAKGKAASDTRYVDGQAYTTKINSYNDRYQPTSSTTTLPEAAGSVAGSYTWTFGYNPYNGVQEWTKHPAIGNLPGERVTTNFNSHGLPTQTTAGGVALVSNVNYDVYSRPLRTEYGTLGRKVYHSRDFDEHTGALTRSTVDGDVALRIEDTRYTYDPAGNTSRISSTSGQDEAAVTDTQCFALDALRRMTEAWTTKSATDDCTTGPSATTVGGPDAYWHSYTYDVTGNRTKETQHATGGASTTITRTYSLGEATEDVPHAVRSVSTVGGPDSGRTETFGYDETGNTVSRKGGSRDQQLRWDAEGHLAEITENGKTTEYLYDSDGDRMLARNADGSAIAYLPGGNELKVTATGSKTATRYYTHGGETVAVRTSAGFSFLFGDHQGTALIAVAMGAAQGVTRRKQLPFGGPRSTTGSTRWPGEHGFLGGTTDLTGYTHLGAREYDPAIGRFISVDPLLVTDDPRQHNPYVYGNANPATFTDPTGTIIAECWTGEIKCSGGKPVTKPSPPGSDNCYTGNMSASCTWANPDHNSPEGKRRSRELAAAIDAPKYCYGGSQSASCFGNGSSPSKQQSDAAKRRVDLERAIEQQKKNEQDGDYWKGFGHLWDNTAGKAVTNVANAGRAVGEHFSKHWRDYLANGVLVAGALGGLACVASAVCGVVAAVAIGSATAAANYAASNAGTSNWNTTSFVINTATGGAVGWLGGTSAAGKIVASRMSFARMERSVKRIENLVNRMKEDQ